MKAVIYDIEIVKGIPDKKNRAQEGIDYCKGWDDHAGMGISVVGAYDLVTDRYRVFLKDNLDDFALLLRDRDTYVSFNGIGFDNKVLAHHMSPALLPEEKCYDILRELWVGDGLAPEFKYPTHIGYSLGDVGYVNFGLSKNGDGALAPIDWQEGRYGTVIDYCLNDIKLTKRCFERIRQGGGLRSPKDPSRFIEMRKP